MSDRLIDLAMACTPKQRAFANELVSGVTASEAYRRAYNTLAKDSILASKASVTRRVPKVAAYITALVKAQERQRFLTRERKREKLADIVESTDAKTSDQIKAIEVDNVMTGDNAPQQVQVFGLTELLSLVRKKS